MKRKAIWIVLTGIVLTSLVLVSCATSATTLTQMTSQNTTITPPVSKTTSTVAPVSTSSTTTTAKAKGNWWDSIGKPKYGGAITLRINRDIASFDPYQGEIPQQIFTAWLEQLFAPSWTMDPSVQPYQGQFVPNSQEAGHLVETWEFSSPGTLVLHIRKGMHWQNISPANGREFVADDVAFHYDRMLGLGHGFTKPAPLWASVAVWKSVISVIATDKYTVEMKWNTPNPEFATENLQAQGAGVTVENPEAVKLWGDLNDWRHALGTGPFILTDFVSGSSATMVRNPDYWGHDERYPQNQLPYIDTLKYLIIPDDATTMAAMRSGKIDIQDGIQWQQAQSIKKTNPEILQVPYPSTGGTSLDPRNDIKPFNDIRVRKALQLAVDLPTIAQSYYGGNADPWPMPYTSSYMKDGWGFPYPQWPQDLKDEYAYNPAAAKKLLADAGYPTGFKTNLVADAAGDITLMQVIKSYFTDIGVDMEIRPLDTASFSAFVVTGHKNDGLAYRPAASLGLSYYPLRQFTRLQTGASSNPAMIADPAFDAFYPKALAVTTPDDLKKVLKDCNEYVARQHYVVSVLQPFVFGICQPWIKGYNAQGSAVTGSSGPLFLYFWEARFWIDQDLKKSMGH
jgi:peptide/nickel transport system substrate-binding protein